MKKLFLNSIILLLAQLCYGQQENISGTVYSAAGKKAISYATIHTALSRKYFDTDEHGRFSLSLSLNDTVTFSCIGFRSYSIAVKDFDKIKDGVFLEDVVYSLPDVIVSNDPPLMIGIGTLAQTRSFAGADMSDSYEIATLMEAPVAKSFRVNRIYFKQKNYSPERKLRLHLYTVDENGAPGTEILKQQVVLSEKNFEKGELLIDVTDQNIIIEAKHFFVGLQWITITNAAIPKGIKNDIGIAETTRTDKRLTFRRGNMLDHTWYAQYESGIYIPVDAKGTKGVSPIPLRGNPVNILASAEITIL